MIGMGFGGFLTLLVISVIVAAVMHNAIRYRFLKGADGFLAKWVVGWLGAWIASPVLGHWFGGVAISSQYIIPAFVGAFAATFMGTALCKTIVRMKTSGVESTERATAPGTAEGQVAHETRAA